jgi:hypothetical protein
MNTTLAGHQATNEGNLDDGAFGVPATALLFGNDDVLTGGDENFLLLGATNDSVVTLGNGGDIVGLLGNANLVTLGAAQDPSVTGSPFATDIAALIGNNNSLTVTGSVDAALIGSNNSMSFTDTAIMGGAGYDPATDTQPAAQQVSILIQGSGDHIGQAQGDAALVSSQSQLSISGGSGNNWVDVQDSGSIALGGERNTVIVGSGTDDISAGSGQDYVILSNTPGNDGTVPLGTETIHLQGKFDQVTGSGHATVTGGTGSETLNMQGITGASYNVSIGGANNIVNIGNGIGTVDAGSGSDTVSLTDIVGAVTFHGRGDMMFLNGNNAATVNDMASGLGIHFDTGSDASQLTITGFDRTGVIDFDPGVGGFTSTSQLMSNLHSDGAGGMVLSSASSGSSSPMIHFVADTHVTASNFCIG